MSETSEMTGTAVSKRLRRVAQLRRLCLSLARATPVVEAESATADRPCEPCPEHQPKDSELLARIHHAVAAAWDAGCPVAGGSPAAQAAIAKAALRRWRSLSSRHKRPVDGELAIRDLAKGLVRVMEPQPDLVGRLIADYRWLASQILDALER